MLILEDILHKKDVFYNFSTKGFESTIPAVTNAIIHEEPVIVIDTLHSCYAHAVLNCCSAFFWVIEDLLKFGYIDSKDVSIFIRKTNVEAYPIQNLPLINVQSGTYNGSWNDIIRLITSRPLIFEHLNTQNRVFKNITFYPEDDKNQRTPWNCGQYYPGVRTDINDVYFSDELIYSKLARFRLHVFDKLGLTNIDETTNDLVIIDRKHNRKFNPQMLNALVKEANKNSRWNFRGVALLEDLTFPQQVELFNKTRYLIFRHGSSLVNLLWSQPKSTVFELMGGRDGIRTSPHVIQRLCRLTDSKQVLLNYDNYDPVLDIFNKI
uniref:Glycosyltransferase 61 catalytic domain-containing protein n=1 Tax=viral metagenome TaxID=1070528 RepID=A0A6C0I5J4_9ZZZZ